MEHFGLSDLGIILLIIVCVGLISMEIPQRLWARYVTLRVPGRAMVEPTDRVDPPRNNNAAMPAQPVAIDNNERNALLLAGRADALAALVHAGKVGETEGIKIVFGASPSSTNKTYQTARELLKARLARLAPEKYKLTPEQEALRARLGLRDSAGERAVRL